MKVSFRRVHGNQAEVLDLGGRSQLDGVSVNSGVSLVDKTLDARRTIDQMWLMMSQVELRFSEDVSPWVRRVSHALQRGYNSSSRYQSVVWSVGGYILVTQRLRRQRYINIRPEWLVTRTQSAILYRRVRVARADCLTFYAIRNPCNSRGQIWCSAVFV